FTIPEGPSARPSWLQRSFSACSGDGVRNRAYDPSRGGRLQREQAVKLHLGGRAQQGTGHQAPKRPAQAATPAVSQRSPCACGGGCPRCRMEGAAAAVAPFAPTDGGRKLPDRLRQSFESRLD